MQVAQKEAQIRLLEGQLRQTDVIGSSHNHMILDALREKAEYIPELQALIHNVQQGEYVIVSLWLLRKNKHKILNLKILILIKKNINKCTKGNQMLFHSLLENGYASTDEEPSEFSQASDSRYNCTCQQYPRE